MAKEMSGSNKSPLSQLMTGGTIRLERLGKESSRVPFVELLDEGWKVEAPKPPLNKHFGGVIRSKKLMIVPLDESPQSLVTKVHEMGHVIMTPGDDLQQMEAATGIPADILNAFEDGRVNGAMYDTVERFRKVVSKRPFPVDPAELQASVQRTMERREALLDYPEHPAHNQLLSEEEIRMMGASLMAAGEMYAHGRHEADWLEVGRACLMNEAQLQKVATLCHELGGMNFQQMVEAVHELADLLLEEDEEEEEEPPPGGGGEGDQDQDDDDGEGMEVTGEAKQGEQEGKPELMIREGEESAMGPQGEGIDYEPMKSGSTLVHLSDPSAPPPPKLKVELPKFDKQQRIRRVGQRVASFDATKTRSKNSHLSNGMLTARPTAHGMDIKYELERAEERAAQAERMRKFYADRRATANQTEQDIMQTHYGVTEREEMAVARRYEGFTSEIEYQRPPMKVHEFPLTETVSAPMGKPRKNRKHDRVGYLTSPVRAHIDGKVYRRKMRVRRLEPTGAILLDLSGSMHPSSELIRRCIEIAPYAVVGGYAGNDSGSGSFAVLARDRKAVSEAELGRIIGKFGGGNSVDYPALEWLARQKGPRVWVSDAGICGCGTNELENVHKCFQLCRQYNIKRVLDLRMLVGEQKLTNNLESEMSP